MIEKLMIEIAPAPVKPVTKPDVKPVTKPEKGSPWDVPAPKVNPTPKGFLLVWKLSC